MLRLVGKRLAKSHKYVELCLIFCRLNPDLTHWHREPRPSFFWVSGYSFSSSAMLTEVPYDPHLQYIFFGEESSMTARLWTHGWDFFAPGTNFIWHLWSRSYRPVFRENKLDTEKERLSFMRIKLQLKMVASGDLTATDLKQVSNDLELYNLGKERSLEEYETFSGVCFAKSLISDKAATGGLAPEDFADHILSLLSGLLTPQSQTESAT